MSAPFVTGLRTGSETISMAPAGAAAITIRVEFPELWDVVRIRVASSEPVLSVKMRALEDLLPNGAVPQDFVVKLHGWEILNEAASLADAGVIDGSILLLTYRRRRAVR